MKRRKWEPLTKEQELEICRQCNGFCCNFFFNNPGEQKNIEFHKFRGRKLIRHGNTMAVLMPDKCQYSDLENRTCTKKEDERFPKVCSDFPNLYRPFWNLKCKLMRERYKRGTIKKDMESFNKLYAAIPKKKKSVFKFYT